MSFIDEVAGRLVAQGVGAINSVIFRSSSATIPQGDGPYVTIIETGGTGASRVHNVTGSTERPTAQIVARAKTYEVARAKLYAAYVALGAEKGLHNITLSGTFYASVSPRQSPTDIGKDDQGRAMVAFNIDAQKQPS